MPSFADIKNSFLFQQKAKKVQKELKSIHVEAEASGVKVAVSAAMEVVSIVLPEGTSTERLSALLVDALNRAMKKAQIVSAEKMQSIMGDMGMPGMK